MCVYVYISIYKCIYTPYMCIYVYTYIFIYIHIFSAAQVLLGAVCVIDRLGVKVSGGMGLILIPAVITERI